jgi:hypothetical protein
MIELGQANHNIPTLVRFVLELSFPNGEVLIPQLNGHDIFFTPLINLQDCGENGTH